MANFQTHLTASTILGLGYGGVAYSMYGVPPSSCLLAAMFCSVSGMLPDIDSGPGRPLREITSCMAAVVPTMAFGHFTRLGLSQESIILIGAAVYVAIRFGLAAFLRHYTVHRGMFHSYVAAAIFGELAFLLLYGDADAVRWYIAGGVVLGFMSHLVLDEIYSVQWDGRPRLKKSFGSAMKFFADGWWPNVTAYAKFVVLTFLVIQEPSLFDELQHGQADQVVEDLEREMRIHQPVSPVISGNVEIPAAKQASPVSPDTSPGEEDRATKSVQSRIATASAQTDAEAARKRGDCAISDARQETESLASPAPTPPVDQASLPEGGNGGEADGVLRR